LLVEAGLVKHQITGLLAEVEVDTVVLLVENRQGEALLLNPL
jgi:hypothetical protein